MPIYRAALRTGITYVDMAMSLSHPHAEHPHTETGTKLGDEQFALQADWEERGHLALVGMGVEPGLSDIFSRYAADHLFSAIDEVGVRDGANLVVEGYEFCPTFSIWTTIEECLNPPVIWERGRGWFTTAPFSEPETLHFPEGIGPVECVNVERGSSSHSPMDRLQSGHVQVRAGRRVYCGAQDAAHARVGFGRRGQRGQIPSSAA
jgi:saccharopine dehydrogenase-like NADP-dependent oxidoreductase